MRTVVVTGPSSGIGLVTAQSLARSGFHIVAAGRSDERTRPVIESIKADGGSAEFLRVDLADLDSVRAAARDLEGRGRPIDVLVNNAGIGMSRGLTGDGFELNFGVNHLGPFLFTNLLRRTFRPAARIINVTSAMHFRVDGIDFDKLTERSASFLGLNDYATSKLANVLFTREMARRQPDWRTYAVHPGFVDTAIIPRLVRPFLRRSLITPAAGAETTIRCATEAALGSETGRYYTPAGQSDPSPTAMDDDLARELWTRSERWCGIGPVD